jgi:hypothetical protein
MAAKATTSPWLKQAQAATPEAPLGDPPGDLYFTYSKPGGDSFDAPASHLQSYLAKGYTVTGEKSWYEDIVPAQAKVKREAAGLPEPADKSNPSSATPSVVHEQPG